VKAAPRWTVGYFSKDGKVRKPSSPRHLATFEFPQRFPSTFQVLLVLAELDQGRGLEKFTAKLAENGAKLVDDKKKKAGIDDLAIAT
jgi:hypothetical protein